jgi:hypothetical protein
MPRKSNPAEPGEGVDEVTNDIDLGLKQKILKIIQNMPPALKQAANPFFKSQYADLSTIWKCIEEAMRTCETYLLIQQAATTEYVLVKRAETNSAGDPQVVEISLPYVKVTTFITDTDTGAKQENTLGAVPKEDTPQAVGSTITYLRRYSLMPIFGICPEDDDGNSASGTGKEPPKRVARPAPTKPPPATPGSRPAAGSAPRAMKPEERKRAGLLDEQELKDMGDMLAVKGVDKEKWKLWLYHCYACRSIMEVRKEMFAGIMLLIEQKPEAINNFAEPEAERQAGEEVE